MIFILTMLVMVVGCGVQRKAVPVQRDSVRVEYRTETVLVRDTAWIEIPKESEKVVTIDTASFLENRYAESYAVIADGLLYHSLETKPQRIAAPTEKAIQVRDTIIYKDRETVVEVPVEVRKEVVPRWCWWLLFANILLVLSYIYYKLRLHKEL